MLKRLLSYIYPIRIHRQESAVSKSLELTWVNGRLLLDSEGANYSYGSLQRVLRRGLSEIGRQNIQSMQRILVLGVAGGSVIRTLRDEFGFRGKIVGVDFDAEVLELARKYFGLDKIDNLEIMVADAREFVSMPSEPFDLIIVDVFTDRDMPMFLYDEDFVDNLKGLLKIDGIILFNTIVLDDMKQQLNDEYVRNLKLINFEVKVLSNIESFNELIIARKKQIT